MNYLKGLRMSKKMRFSDYPIGTKAHAIGGGYWIKTSMGWKWFTGATFPTPGGDVERYELPENSSNGTVADIVGKVCG